MVVRCQPIITSATLLLRQRDAAVAELVSTSGVTLAELLSERRAKFPSSGEMNIKVQDADASIAAVRAAYADGAEVDEMDGLSLAHDDWRLNVRKSNTEPLVRLNVEERGGAVDLEELVGVVGEVIQGAAHSTC